MARESDLPRQTLGFADSRECFSEEFSAGKVLNQHYLAPTLGTTITFRLRCLLLATLQNCKVPVRFRQGAVL